MNSTKETVAKGKDKKSKKLLQVFLDSLKSPTAIGIYVTVIFLFISNTFYKIKSQNEDEREQLNHPALLNIFKGIERLDLLTMDGRFTVRGEVEPESKVGLLAIDDRSIEEIGRWPWSREKIAFVVEEMMKYGASAIGFDIVFSEPQIDLTFQTLNTIEQKAKFLPPNIKQIFEAEKLKGQPDKVLADTITKHQNKIVLGSFYDEDSATALRPYQDYCRNVAFIQANSDKFVKSENLTFIVEDLDDPFVDMNLDPLFNQIFPFLRTETIQNELKETFNKKSVDDLNDREKAQLRYTIERKQMDYCEVWLTDRDRPDIFENLKPQYTEIFSKTKLLADLPVEEAVKKFKDSVKLIPIKQHKRWTINTDQMQAGAIYTGSFNAEQDADGSIRNASMFFRTGNRFGTSFIPSIALQTYLIATKYRANIEIDKDPKNSNQKIISKFTITDPDHEDNFISQIPVDEQGRIKINYAGPRNMYPYLPAKELFNGKDTAEIQQRSWNSETKSWVLYDKPTTVKKADFIKDRAFIFGATAIGVYDLRVTPFDKNYPGPETHVSTLGNLFQHNFIRPYPNEDKIMLLAIVTLGLILSIAISHTQAVPGLMIALTTGVGIFFFDQFILSKGFIATMALPGLLIFVLFGTLFAYKYLTEERKKKYLKSTFSKYVSPAIVDEILKDPENIELGGKKMRMAIFFSDLRNFTTISEKLQATELSDVLNLYLTPMTQIVFANKGTLDKYIGDAVMAFFGAPISFADHSKWACRCAILSIEKLKDIRAEIDTKFPGKNIPIEIGIGINTADVSAGNMGSDIVQSYTIMGDGVNLASRLEGITKEYGVQIVISEFTYADVKEEFTCRELDWVRVKGKLEPIRIFELINEGKPKTPQAEDLLKYWNEGFDLYHKKQFAEAKTRFQKILEIKPEDPPAELYVERCDEYLAEPPPENWNGVHVMKTK